MFSATMDVKPAGMRGYGMSLWIHPTTNVKRAIAKTTPDARFIFCILYVDTYTEADVKQVELKIGA